MKTALPILLLLLAACVDDPPAPPPAPPKPVTYTRDAWLIRGKPTLLLAGTFDTYRVPPAEWERRLTMMKRAGLNTVDLYIAWNVHQPSPHVFDFSSPRADLERCFTLCEKLGLYVYVRPGPFICNETDGGGLPAWLFAETSETASAAPDGKVRVREKDADFLHHVGRYFDALNAIVKKHELTLTGGCVVLYALANEHDSYALLRQAYKLGTPPDVPGYLAALRDMLRADGITVPLTTAPNNGVNWHGTGNVAGIVPCPNLYDLRASTSIEGQVREVLESLHHPLHHEGHYAGMPSLISETERSATRLARVLYGGMDGVNLFNFNGFPVGGYENALTINFSLGNGITPETLLSTLREPTIGYFPGQIDYRSPISRSGGLRAKYYRVRRTAHHFAALSEQIAAAGTSQRTGPRRTSARLSVSNPLLGAAEQGGRAVYWLESGKSLFFGLLNQTADPQATTVTIDGESWPRHSTMLVASGAARAGAPHEKWVDKLLLWRLPLGEGYPELRYATSELFTRFDATARQVLVLSGEAGTPGELALEGLAGATVLHDSLAGSKLHKSGARWTWTYTHRPDGLLVLGLPGGKRLVLLVTTTAEAERLWRLVDEKGEVWLLSDAAYVAGLKLDASGAPLFDAEWDGRGDGKLLLLGPRAVKGLALDGATLSGKRVPSAGVWLGSFAVAPAYPAPPALTDATAAREPEADDSAWSATTSGPEKLEALGIYRGHAWHRTTFRTDTLPGTRVFLRVAEAAGIVSGWLNGRYFGTDLPRGRTTGASHSLEMTIPPGHFKLGTNELAFRVQIWGHSSFEVPPLVPGVLDFPALQVAYPRGLWGKASLASLFDAWTAALDGPWRYRAELHGERHGWAGTADPAGAKPVALPLALDPGATVWHRTKLDGAALPHEKLRLPLAIKLAGKGVVVTVFANGHHIGRWISDDETLTSDRHGAGKRDQWMPEELDPDTIYLPRSLLVPGENTIALAVESLVKGPYATRGADRSELSAVSLVHAADGFDKSIDGGKLRAVALPLAAHD